MLIFRDDFTRQASSRESYAGAMNPICLGGTGRGTTKDDGPETAAGLPFVRPPRVVQTKIGVTFGLTERRVAVGE